MIVSPCRQSINLNKEKEMAVKTTIVFTDDRLDGVEIRCYGSSTFEIYRDGEFADMYTHYESDKTNNVSGMFAKKSAESHFEMMINGEIEV